MGLAQETRDVYNLVVGGSGVTITRYPATAAGVALKASGLTTGAWKYAAANANVKAIVARATILVNWWLAWLILDTLSATSLFVVKLGNGAAAAGPFSQVAGEFQVNAVTVTAVGEYVIPPVMIPYAPMVIANGVTDAVLADMASSNAAADDTADCAVGIATGKGT